VLHKLVIRLPASLRPSLLGSGLPERLRSTTLALTGLVGAVCLVMVGLTLQHGVPIVSSGPIHDPVRSEVGPAQALADRASEAEPDRRRRARPAAAGPRRGAQPVADPDPAPVAAPPVATPVASTPVDRGQDDAVGGGGGRRPSGKAPSSKPRPSAPPPPAAAPVEEPVASPSRDVPEPASEEPVEDPAVPGNGNAYGKGGGGPESAGPPGLAKGSPGHL
jgi:hypothetical protein